MLLACLGQTMLSTCSCTKSTVTQVSIMFAERLNDYFTEWMLQLLCWFYIATQLLPVAAAGSVSATDAIYAAEAVSVSVSIRNLCI